MNVKGLIWLGLRTTQFEEMAKFFREVMGMQLVREEAGLAGFRLIDQTQVELYRPEEEFHAFFTTGPVVGGGFQHELSWRIVARRARRSRRLRERAW
jgi:catechol 2,3-dioxygenase-like lactoylglutathione lyase family enzyme